MEEKLDLGMVPAGVGEKCTYRMRSISQVIAAFWMPGKPTGQKRFRATARGGFVRTYKDKGQAEAEVNMLACMMAPESKRPAEPYRGAVYLGVAAFFPLPETLRKRKKFMAHFTHYDILRPTRKPDLSNIIKHVEDVANGVLFGDDAMVVGFIHGTGKYYTLHDHGVLVAVSTVPFVPYYAFPGFGLACAGE